MIEINQGIYRLGSTHHNFYVFAEGGKATVIDAGCSKEWLKLIAGLTTIGLGPHDVEAILITHAHADPIGFGREAEKNSVRVEVHRDEEPRALGTYEGRAAISPTQLPLWRPGTWRFLIALLRVGVTRQPRLKSVETFDDGDVLDLPGKPRVVHTPGHTEGHSAFFIPSAGAVFTGDALATRNLVGRNRLEPQIMPDAFHNDPVLNRQSLGRLASLEADLVLPGHGSPFRGSPSEAVAQALAGR